MFNAGIRVLLVISFIYCLQNEEHFGACVPLDHRSNTCLISAINNELIYEVFPLGFFACGAFSVFLVSREFFLRG